MSQSEPFRTILRSLRAATPGHHYKPDLAASSDIRIGYVNDTPAGRLVITFRAPGCAWVTRGGGCVMCGHYAGTTRGRMPTVHETVAQFRTEIARYDLSPIAVLSLYNSGSMLNPEEMPPEALRTILRDVRAIPSIRKVVLESRAEYVNRAYTGELADILGPDTRLSVAMGLETADEMLRTVCLNKGCDTKIIGEAVRALDGIASVQLYVLLGIPFLTEAEAVADAVSSVRFAHELGADEIHIEPVTIQRHTLVELLESRGLYRMISLHSVYETLARVLPGIRPYVSPFLHMPTPDRIPEGCPACTNRMITGLLDVYNRQRTPESLDLPYCPCRDIWLKRMAEADPRPIARRIAEALDIISCGATA